MIYNVWLHPKHTCIWCVCVGVGGRCGVTRFYIALIRPCLPGQDNLIIASLTPAPGPAQLYSGEIVYGPTNIYSYEDPAQ